MAEKTLKEIIKEEYKKCLVDPIYFMKKYVKIQHPIRGTINFDLYPFQEETLDGLIKNDFNIILKSRQMGISTLVAAYSLWLMVFHTDKNIRCISITQETSKEIVTRVRFANDNLPVWLKVPVVENNRLSLILKNGSTIKAESSAATAGRSAALSLLIIDEAAFIDNIEEIWLSAQYTLSTGGHAIILSTPNGVGNFFHNTWVDAEAKKNNFNTIKLPWHLHPERDQKWRDQQTALSGVKGSAQECDCDFSTTGNTVIDIPTLDFYKNEKVKDPIEMRGIDKSYWIWEYPDYSRSYIVCLPTGESVLTNSGIKKIENITYNDKLINKNGNYTDIVDIKIRQYIGKIYEITPSNTFRTTKFTDEHPILVSQSSKLVRMHQKNNINYKFNQRYWEHDFQFVDAKNVKVGDWICYPNVYKKNSLIGVNQIWSEFENLSRIDFQIKNNPLQNKDFWWFVGIWLAEGWCYTDKNGTISIHTAHNSNEIEIIDKLKNIVNSVFDRELTVSQGDNNTTYCKFNSKQIGMLLEKHFGKYAGGKFISENIKYLKGDFTKELINGYIAGDGCFIDTKTNGKNAKITSISLKLLEDVQDILFSIGCISTINLLRKEKLTYIRNKPINQKEAYCLTIHDFGCSKILNGYVPKSKTQRISDCYFSNNEEYIYFKVKKVKEFEYQGLVHNFTTSTGTFLCRNITTHNCADVARGDGADYSAFHVIDVESFTQVAEYQGQINTKDYGNMLVSVATEYNNALLVVENANIGWAVLQQIIDRGYPNTFYSSADLQYVDIERQISNKFNAMEKKMVPGFTTTMKTQPLIVSRLEMYFRERSIEVRSARLVNELRTFVWHGNKPEALPKYHDDLVMSFSIGMWVRDTALKLRQQGVDITKSLINNINKLGNADPVYKTGNLTAQQAWEMNIGKTGNDKKESLKWLL